MSSPAVEALPAGEVALAGRIQQIQSMVDEAHAVATGRTLSGALASSGTGSTDFASALQAATAAEGSEGGQQYDALIEQAAARNGLDPALLHGLIEQESGFDPSAQSGAGAMGLTQLMPGTASSMGVANPLDPAESIEGGARYLSQLMGEFGGNTADALAAYNAGPGAVRQYGGVPPYSETQSYVSKVLGYAEASRQSGVSMPSATGVSI
jgi:soluble lytic murein transglycosylase-like protein